MIAAEGEQKASRALKEASEVIAQSSSALQLRYLQVTIWKNNQKLLSLKYCFFFLDTQLHIGREELYHYFPPPDRLHNTFPQGQARKRGESWLKCSRQRVDLKKKEKRKICKVFLWDAVTNFSDSLYFGRRTLWFKEAWISITFIISTYHSCAPQLCITKVIKHTKAWFFHFCKPSCRRHCCRYPSKLSSQKMSFLSMH